MRIGIAYATAALRRDEPAKIAHLLPEMTFIAEGAGRPACRFRLAGTKICEQFGRELRGADILSRPSDQGLALQFAELQDPDSLARIFG